MVEGPAQTIQTENDSDRKVLGTKYGVFFMLN